MGALISEDILEPGEKVLTFDYMVGFLFHCPSERGRKGREGYGLS